MRIGIDLDGCAYPFVETITKYASERFGVDMPPFTHWNSHEKLWGLTHDQLKHLMIDAMREQKLWWNEQPHEGFADATQQLSRMGHTVVIATDRLQGTPWAEIAQTATRHWLRRYGVVFDELLFTSDKRDANADVFIEDRPKAVPMLLLDGVDALYMTRPWNEWFPYNRVNSWAEFVEYIDRKPKTVTFHFPKEGYDVA